MAIFRSILTISLFLAFLNVSNALYEDQVGKFDWRRSFIGKVKQARFDNKRLFVTTQENVLASINPKSGQILWRQTLEDPHKEQPHALYIDTDVCTVSGAEPHFYIRCWDAATGSLLREFTATNEPGQESAFVFHKNAFVRVTFKNAQLQSHLHDLHTGEPIDVNTHPASWFTSFSKCAAAAPFMVCHHNNELYWVDLHKDDGPHSRPIAPLLGSTPEGPIHLIELPGTKPAVLLLHNNDAKLIEIHPTTLTAAPFNLLSNAIPVENRIFQLEVNPENPDKLVRIKSMDRESGGEASVDVDYPRGLGAPFILAGQCRGTTCDLLLSSTDHALTLVHVPDGSVSWTREEALSDIVTIEFFELPVSELDASIENEFTTASSDVFSMLTHRLCTQSKQLYNLFFGGQLLANNGLVRDEFGLHKIIVVATSVGKLFGIDTLTGSIAWSYRLPGVKPFSDGSILLFVQRTATYAPLPAQCILLAQDLYTGAGIMFKFDPITGVSLRGIERLPYRIKQALILPHEDGNHLKPVVVVDSDSSIHVYPEDGRSDGDATFFYTIEGAMLRGHQVGNHAKSTDVWGLNLGESRVVAVSSRALSERVHSQGRVLPDRSVYYKYVNPNLIAVATLSDDPVHRHVLSVYLIDGVTGFVLYSTSHRRASGPVHLVHSENWLVYTFFNERFRRFEVVAAELYEGFIQSNTTAFSSFSVSQLPHVQTQSYILPTTPVSMTVTLTERGITSKCLLIGLSTGGVVEIPWLLLQPRFDDIACGPEEACIPYMPEIPLPAEATINYNHTLERIKGIVVAPARLESTSHVLVYGLDLFYTRVAPSKTFDVLKEDFDYKLIILVLVALIGASYVSKYLAAKKTLRQAWK